MRLFAKGLNAVSRVARPAMSAEFLLDRRNSSKSLETAQTWAELDDLYSKRLWHQLTQKLSQFVHHKSFQDGGLLQMYKQFLSHFEHRINPLTLAEITLVISGEITDLTEAVHFLEQIEEKVKDTLEARILCKIQIGVIQLKCGKQDEVKGLIEEAGLQLDSVDGITAVHARYYDLCSKYHKLKGDHAEYYRDALHYLGCVDLKSIPEEQVDRAFSLALAALLGDCLYNFGELLAHPVLQSLSGTDKEWVIKLLYAFNAGDLVLFEKLRIYWENQADLCAHEAQLYHKLRLLALMELVFRRHSHDRTIEFVSIAEVAQVPIDQVEHIVMKALSLGLLKGTLDQVKQTITMTWVQPRVLEITQVSNLEAKMSIWCKHIKDTIVLVKDEVPEVTA